jgi:hypothetical protein
MCLSVCEAIDFKVVGSAIYWKNSEVEVYGDFDYMIFIGCSKERLKNGKPEWIFKDESNIKKVIKDSLHEQLFIEKENSKWIMDYSNLAMGREPRIILREPDLESEKYIRNYIKQIYPVSKELNK